MILSSELQSDHQKRKRIFCRREINNAWPQPTSLALLHNLQPTEVTQKRINMSDQQDSGSSSSGSVNVQQLKSQLANRFQASRPLVLKLHSILTWEQDIYPIFVLAFVSFAFLFIHLLNSSVLTTLSYVGIAAALLDLAMPTIAKNLTGGSQAKLSEKDNQRFDKICLDLAKLYALVMSACDACCSMKSKKPKLYYPALLGSLLVSAYIGNKFNNLFLTYLVTLLIAFYPGLEKKGAPQKAAEFVFAKLGRRPPAFLTGSSNPAGGDSSRRASGKKN